MTEEEAAAALSQPRPAQFHLRLPPELAAQLREQGELTNAGLVRLLTEALAVRAVRRSVEAEREALSRRLQELMDKAFQ